MELSLSLEATHVLVTGAAGHIGRLVVTAFLSAGAHVSALDLSPSLFTSLPSHPDLLPLSADVTSTSQLAEAFKAARERFGTVECCIHLAGLDLSVLSKKGVVDMEPEDWERVLGVNVGGAFSVSREWAKEIREVISNREAVEGSLDGQVEKDNAARRIDETKVRSEGGEMTTSKGQGKKALKNVSLILVGSESGWFGERMNAAYAASKSAIQVGLLQSLRAEVPRIYERARYVFFEIYFTATSRPGFGRLFVMLQSN